MIYSEINMRKSFSWSKGKKMYRMWVCFTVPVKKGIGFWIIIMVMIIFSDGCSEPVCIKLFFWCCEDQNRWRNQWQERWRKARKAEGSKRVSLIIIIMVFVNSFLLICLSSSFIEKIHTSVIILNSNCCLYMRKGLRTVADWTNFPRLFLALPK